MMWSKPMCSRRPDWERVLEARWLEVLGLERKKSGDWGLVLPLPVLVTSFVRRGNGFWICWHGFIDRLLCARCCICIRLFSLKQSPCWEGSESLEVTHLKRGVAFPAGWHSGQHICFRHILIRHLVGRESAKDLVFHSGEINSKWKIKLLQQV